MQLYKLHCYSIPLIVAVSVKCPRSEITIKIVDIDNSNVLVAIVVLTTENG